MKLVLLDTNNTGIKAVFRYSTDDHKSLHRLGVIYDDTKQWLFRADEKPLPVLEDELQQLVNEVVFLNRKHYPKPLELHADGGGFVPNYDVH